MKNIFIFFTLLLACCTKGKAQNDNCSLYDTVYNGALQTTAAADASITITKHIQTSTVAYLIGTSTTLVGSRSNLLMAVKANTGRPLWSKKWQSQPVHRGLIDVAILSGYVYTSDAWQGTTFPTLVLSKWDTLGNRIWTKQISLTNLPAATTISAMVPLLDTNGNRLALSVNLLNNSSPLFEEGICAMELDTAGNCLWAKLFGLATSSNDYPFVNNKPAGIRKVADGTGDYLLFSTSGGRPFDAPVGQPANRYQAVLTTRFLPTANTYTARYHLPAVMNTMTNISFLQNKDAQSFTRLQNGKFLLAAHNVNAAAAENAQNARFFFELTNQLQASNGVTISCKRYEVLSSPYMLPSGKILLTDPKNTEDSFSVAVVQNRQLEEEKKYSKSSLFTSGQTATANQYITRPPTDDQPQISLLYHVRQNGLPFTEISVDNPYITRPTCGYRRVQERTATPVNVYSSTFAWDAVLNVTASTTPLAVQEETVQPLFQNTCGVASRCDSVVLVVPDTVCPGQSFSLVLRKNRNCYKQVQLIQSANVQLVNIPNDSTYVLRIAGPGPAQFTARFPDCNTVLATAQVVVGNSIGPSALLPFQDTTICPGQAIILTAMVGLQHYNWNNGVALSSSLQATAPGWYRVSAQNYCGVTFSDSVLVKWDTTRLSLQPAALSICLKDTATFSLPITTPLHHFQWQPAVIAVMDSVNGRFSAWPVQNTSFVVKAQSARNCTVSDTVRVTILPQPAIRQAGVSNIQSVCPGDTAGFILQRSDLLHSFRWQPDTTAKVDSFSYTFQAWPQQNTTYTIAARNNSGCEANDTVFVRMHPLPAVADILPRQQYTVCEGEVINIETIRPFASYRWSNGDTTKVATFRRPGQYSIRITNAYHCAATTSFTLEDSVCSEAIYFPSAFSPNGDGLNDLFRASTIGRGPSVFALKIYNRWGQLVFSSSNYRSGWDGRRNGVLQPAGTYIWQCIYITRSNTTSQQGSIILLQ